MSIETQKPIIGFSCGDLNGIGLEIILKTLSDGRLLDFCTPVIFASSKSVNFYRKSLPESNFSYASGRDFSKLNPKQVNIYSCWEEEVVITPGQLNDIGGKYALLSLEAAGQALKEGHIDGLVTAPIHKKNIQSETFNYSGHTPYFKNLFGVKDVLMFMVAENIRIGLLTEHVTISEVHKYITVDGIMSKLKMMHASLQQDFSIDKPKIAVLGLNPHAGDEGLIGKEELEIIKPAIAEARKNNMLVFGPYSADAFFARGQYEKFDAVLAMYHDQGLPVLKHASFGAGVNVTLGLPILRTSVDHGTALALAGTGRIEIGSRSI